MSFRPFGCTQGRPSLRGESPFTWLLSTGFLGGHFSGLSAGSRNDMFARLGEKPPRFDFGHRIITVAIQHRWPALRTLPPLPRFL